MKRIAMVSLVFVVGAAIGFAAVFNICHQADAQSSDYYKAQMKYGEASAAYSTAKDKWVTEKDRYQATDKTQTDLSARFEAVKAKMTKEEMTTCSEVLFISSFYIQDAGKNVNTSYQFKIMAGDQLIDAALLIEIKEYQTAYNVASGALSNSNSSIEQSKKAQTNCYGASTGHTQITPIIQKYESP
jgi:hypothetical protein